MRTPIDVILTCCGRFDLLTRTLDSFFKVNTYPIRKFIIHDDKGLENYTQFEWDVVDAIQRKFNKTLWIQPVKRVGQILSLDKLMTHVETYYYFNLEEDWLFLKDGFIEESIKVLEKYPMCNQVQLRGPGNINGHNAILKDGILQLEKGHGGRWDGWGLNPSVRRKSDYDMIGSYSHHTSFVTNVPFKAELDLARLYSNMGYFTAVLPDKYIEHIGHNRTVR